MKNLSMSRRALLVQGGVAAVSLTASPVLAEAQSGADKAPDEGILTAALGMEEATLATYDQIHDLQILSRDDRALTDRIISNHRKHADRLRTWLRRFGRVPDPSGAQVSIRVQTAQDALELLVKTEQAAMTTYLTHAASLYYRAILADAVLILVDEVKHHTVLSARLGARSA